MGSDVARIAPVAGGLGNHSISGAVYLLPRSTRAVREYLSHRVVADSQRFDRYATRDPHPNTQSSGRRPSDSTNCIYTYLNTSGDYDPNLDLLIDVQCGGGGGGGGGASCPPPDVAVNADDINNFLNWLATALKFGWSTDLGPKVNAFGNTIKDNANKTGKGNDVNGRVYDHSTGMFGKAASQLSEHEREFYDWMKYTGPAFRDTNRGFIGTQIGNPNFELYAFKSEKWIDIARVRRSANVSDARKLHHHVFRPGEGPMNCNVRGFAGGASTKSVVVSARDAAVLRARF